jgi:hypothetical protein
MTPEGLAVKLAVNYVQNKKATPHPNDESRLNSGILWEPAVGFEPTACCLRNGFRWFGTVRERSPARENHLENVAGCRCRSLSVAGVGVKMGVA